MSRFTEPSSATSSPLSTTSPHLLQAMLDGSLHGVVLLEPIYADGGEIDDFRILAANRMLGEMTGTDSSQLVGQTMTHAYPAYKQGEFFALYCQTLADGVARKAEYFYDHQQLKGWFTVTIARQGTYLVLTTANTSQVREEQLATAQAALRLQAVIDHSQTGIFVFSPVFDEQGELIDFRFKTINRMVAALVGQTPDVITGQVASEWFISYRETGLFERYRHTYLTGEPQRFEIHYNVDGMDQWFDVQSVRLEADVLVTFTDFSALKLVQQAVEQQAEANHRQSALLNSVLDSSNSGIIAFAAIREASTNAIIDFRFLLANKACEGILGMATEPLVGQTLSAQFPGNWESGLFDLYAHTTNTGEPGRTEIYYNLDGLDFWLDISAQQLGDGFVVTFNDISILKRLQQQLENSIANLQRSNGNLEQFAYVASHDLQEPLRKIQSFGDVLRTNFAPDLSPDAADLINRMQLSSARMSSLIRDLLAYSRLSAQGRPRQPVSLDKVLLWVLDDLDLSLRETGAVVHTKPLPSILGDEVQLRQLMQNLLTNAIKFRQAEVTPVITVTGNTLSDSELPASVLPLKRAKTYVCLAIADNGIGFDNQYAERIFQVFQRLHGRTQYEGTGIGLAIVQKVADNHGGAIAARSEPGRGATFSVYLPVS